MTQMLQKEEELNYILKRHFYFKVKKGKIYRKLGDGEITSRVVNHLLQILKCY